MNKLRTKKTIGFLIAGIIVLCLSVLKDSYISLLSKMVKEPETVLHIYSFVKFAVLTLGFVLIGVGIYNLVMIFVEEEVKELK